MMALAQAYVLASLFTCIVGDFQCICNYISALPVYSQASKHSPQIGTLGEFECKSEVRVQIQDWYRIALNHRYGFVESTTGMVLQQTCPGSPSKDDIATVGQNFLPTTVRPTPAVFTTPSTTHMTTRKASSGTPIHTTPFNLFGNLFGIIGGTVSSSIGDLSRCPPALQAWEAQARSHLLAQWGASCYTLDTNNRQSLNNADTLCHVVSSHVVDIQTRQEQDFLQGFLKLKGFHEKVWTGYTDRLVENHFTWTTGANASFNNFKPGEKTTLLHNNFDCTVINPNNHGLWETRPCYEIYTFFCEYGTII